jgi:hypothetical protein
LFHRLHHPVRLHQFVEDFLQDVFCVAAVGHPSTDEVSQPRFFALDRFRDLLVLLHHHPLFSQRLVHLPL